MEYLVRAARQHALITRSQLIAVGVSEHQIKRLLTTGRLQQVHRAVYRIGGSPATARQALLAAVLSADCSMASHRSAAELWGIGGVRSIGPEITVPGKARPRLAGVIVHRTDTVYAVDIAEIDGITATSTPRTALDLGAVLPMDRVEWAIEDAVVRLGTQFSALRDCLDRLAARGRNGCGVLRTLLDARDPTMAAPQSELEMAIIRILRRAQVPEPERQYWLERRGASPVCLDLAWPERRFGIEADSRVWHAGRRDVQRNTEKHNTITLLGWDVLRYTWVHVHHRRAEMVAEISGFLARSERYGA